MTPLNCGIGFYLNYRIGHFRLRLGFYHQNTIVGFSNKVRHVFWMFYAITIVNFELTFGWLKPLLRVTLQNYREATFGIGIKLLYGDIDTC